MKKYLVPCAALLGIALLCPRADAAGLLLKSKPICPGSAGDVSVAVNQIGGSGELWAIDFTLKLGSGLSAVDAANAFTPAASTAADVVVTGAPTVGTGVANPDLYVGYVRGTTAMATGADATFKPIGKVRLAVAAGTTVGTAIDIANTVNYNVANDGTGSTTVSRAAATAATSTATAGAAVVAETVTLLNAITATGNPVPQHLVVVAKPGNVTLDATNTVNIADVSNLAAFLASKATLTDAKKVAADAAPAAHAATGGRGDGNINIGDLSLIASALAGKSTLDCE